MGSLPTWDSFLIPCLKVLSDGEVHRRRDVIESASESLGLSDEDKLQTIPSGQQTYLNRGNWAMTHLSKAGAISSPYRANWQITDLGRSLLLRFPEHISEAQFKTEMAQGQYGDFLNSKRSKVPSPEPEVNELSEPLTPFELAEAGQQRNFEMVREELLSRLRTNEPVFFEQAVLDLLMEMGYGGSLGKATRTQLTNDAGIDGVIDQDALGLNRVYVQAKRYAEQHAVGRPEIQAFVGALHGAQANQGVFLTTSTFTPAAKSYADSVQLRVVLVDGSMLTQLMVKHGVGVQTKRTIHLVEIDEDYFE